MSNSPYTISNYQPADFDKYVRLVSEAEKLEPTKHCVSAKAVAENLGRPNHSPEQDLFLAEIVGNICEYPKTGKKLVYFYGPGGVLLELAQYPGQSD